MHTHTVQHCPFSAWQKWSRCHLGFSLCSCLDAPICVFVCVCWWACGDHLMSQSQAENPSALDIINTSALFIEKLHWVVLWLITQGSEGVSVFFSRLRRDFTFFVASLNPQKTRTCAALLPEMGTNWQRQETVTAGWCCEFLASWLWYLKKKAGSGRNVFLSRRGLRGVTTWMRQ